MSDFTPRFEAVFRRYKEVAVARGLSASKLGLGTFLGVTRGRVNCWAAGQVPSTADLFTIRDKLGFSVSWLLGGDGDPFAVDDPDAEAPVPPLPSMQMMEDLRAQLAITRAELNAERKTVRDLLAQVQMLTTRLLAGDDGVKDGSTHSAAAADAAGS